ncbi:aldehyde dehydrogenase family protein [Actinomycetospora endophytica]|uniref:Aldehyde dehydrogenase family protein n=1 Tax=Actinomycetospora endophytica TaxID=2291215 RepID=A0ABS8PH93_9PSEU|nr:aldehyde dehydrogenase family protein [Actinomycetospora endophytica]MCD2197539.1 aldehyde dehydrogenase family protein [Actinomycetospora endophytica]
MGLLDADVWTGKLLDGGWRAGAGAERIVVEPATGTELGRVATASPDDVTGAADRAAAAQREWAARPFTERAAILRRAGDLWEAHAEEVQGWIVRESGGITPKAQLETHIAAQECFEAAALASHPTGEILRSEQPRLSFARRRPAGVVGVIAPFNFPLILAIRAVAPALALGNAVVLKPDPRTAVCGGVSIARVFEEAGLPAGLLAMLPGGAEDVGEAVIADPRVRVVAFTGSTRAGRAVGALAAQHLTRAHLELGGNSALIVMGDVDVEQAASIGAFGSFMHQGQICMTTGRHVVDAAIADDYVAALAQHAEKLPVGDPSSGTVALGPIIDAGQRDHVHELVTGTVDGGARLEAGGTYEDLYYRPTVLSGVTRQSPAWAQEVFGPVAPVIPYASEDEAVALAADSEYGLSLGILAGDGLRALELSDRIPSGAVHINDQTVADEATIPFGGWGASGNGSRTGGIQANLDAYTETQWVTAQSRLAQYPF